MTTLFGRNRLIYLTLNNHQLTFQTYTLFSKYNFSQSLHGNFLKHVYLFDSVLHIAFLARKCIILVSTADKMFPRRGESIASFVIYSNDLFN